MYAVIDVKKSTVETLLAFEQVLVEVADKVSKNNLFVSVAAGISTQSMERVSEPSA